MPSAAIHTTIPLYIRICSSCSEFMFHVYSTYTYICRKLPRFQVVYSFPFSPKYVAGCHANNDPHQRPLPPDDVHGNFLQISSVIAGRRIRVGREENNIRQSEAEPYIIPYPFQFISSLLPYKRYRQVCIYVHVRMYMCMYTYVPCTFYSCCRLCLW